MRRITGTAAVLVLMACGGGGGGSAALPVVPPATGSVTTDLQAKILAARSANAMFAYDNMNSESIVAALGSLPIGAGFGSGIYAVPCPTGSGSVSFNDADTNAAVSGGGIATLAATACQSGNGFPWIFGGSVRVDILGGVSVEQHLFAVAAGSAQLGVTHTSTALGGSRTATGTYSLSTSNTADGAPLTQAVAMPDLTIAHANVNLSITGLTFTVTSVGTLASAAGTFATSVAGVGNLQLALSVKSPLTIGASSTRFRPTAGTLALTAADFSFDVVYGPGGAVTIRVDNGRDGTVDRTVSTTESELDSLMTTP